MTDALEQAVASILDDHCTYEVIAKSERGLSIMLWDLLAQAGFTGVGVPEDLGGAGGDLLDAAQVIRVAARYAAPLPLVETLLQVGGVCEAAGLGFPSGPTTLVVGPPGVPISAARTSTGWIFDGLAQRVPWARNVERLVVVAKEAEGHHVAGVIERTSGVVSPGLNMANEPRDDVTLHQVRLASGAAVALPEAEVNALRYRAALGRSLQIAGALEGVLQLTIQYAKERVQFGRPIGRFQAVQHQVAELAGETVAAVAAADAATRAVLAGGGELAVAAAKIRTGMAAGQGARLAHQVHGTIGFTLEHPLGHLTRRLWAWRDEGGSAQGWAVQLGSKIVSNDPDGVWDMVTTMMEGTP